MMKIKSHQTTKIFHLHQMVMVADSWCNGKFVITNYHVIEQAKISVRNGSGNITQAIVLDYSKDYDLAILN